MIRFTQSARRHKIGKASALFVMDSAEPTETVTNRGDAALRWVGPDERGRELDIIAVPLDDGTLLVTHVFPTALNER